MNRDELLIKVIESGASVRDKWTQILKNAPSQQYKKLGLDVMWYDFENLALQAFFLRGDVQKAKQCFYTCGNFDVYLTVNFDSKILDYGINHLAYALLSDNQPLILQYSELSHSSYEILVQAGSSTPMAILQALIKEDWNRFERLMPIMKAKSAKKFGMELDVNFYEALAKRDKSKCEEVLNQLLTSKVHQRRNKHHLLTKEFISHPAIGYAKLAWLKGIEVQVNDHLVPLELLPLKPNQVYFEEYDFLQS